MSKTRYLRKIDDGHLYVWTEGLAKRKDMVEVEGPAASLKGEGAGAPAVPPVVPDGAGDNDGSDIDPVAITDKDELARLLTERGVKFHPNTGLVKLQQMLAASLKGEGE